MSALIQRITSKSSYTLMDGRMEWRNGFMSLFQNTPVESEAVYNVQVYKFINGTNRLKLGGIYLNSICFLPFGFWKQKSRVSQFVVNW